MSSIELVDLTKHYKQGKNVVKALDGVSLEIAAGEFVSIVGRSGSGKTTLLDVVGLLLRPTSGQVLIGGEEAGRLKDNQRADVRGQRIGFIFQEYNLLPTLRYTRSRAKDGRGRALELLEAVGLTDRLKHRPDELSGGQQQRVAIARALINRPAIVLGDEPTGSVDTQTSQELIGLMRWLNREEGVTFVIVTHDLDLAGRADRMIGLKDGHVVSDQAVEHAA